METVVLINCGSKHKDYPCPVLEMYGEGRLFKKSLEYARNIVDDKHIHVITFLQGCSDLDTVVECYDKPPSSIPTKERYRGMMRAVTRLSQLYPLDDTKFILLTTTPYPARP